MTDRMNALVQNEFGGPDVLHIEQIERPKAGPGEVLIEIAYASVNPADWKTRQGMLSKYITYHFPFVLGFDLAGRVAEVGPGVQHYAVGDLVYGTSQQGMGRNGSYAEYTTAYEATLQPLPKSGSLKEAAALPTAGITAYGGLVDVGELKAGQTVLINGGAGGVGTIAIQIAVALGARVAVTCSAGNADYVAKLGAEKAIDYRQEDVVAAVNAWAPGGVDLVLDAVGQGSLLPRAGEIVRKGGRYVEIETLISEASEGERAAARDQGFEILSNMQAIARLPQQFEGLAKLYAEGKVHVAELTEVPLAEVPEAHRKVEQGHVRGKIAIAVNPALEPGA
ncbi:NADP-dependent oxidoreductase [Sphingomonas sp. C3-2]|uniref:NADP-dependent oxidoreductase n=1 Tax=Sphingomonas sp. C3-2 TaxID=3062169 RepID=UPI00294B35F8|nr:NADP-dependent oxidoreductase [Sphingomonas sp. C3-2]WOK35997.1 NADP-dependent oxidoreductase [Sphingomonas sp. C3-2]